MNKKHRENKLHLPSRRLEMLNITASRKAFERG